MMPWHQQPAEAVLQALRTSGEGLTAVEAERRLAEHGPNVLREGGRRTALGMLAGQFTDFMILVLLGAAVISGLIGDVVDTIAIVAIVVLNAVIGGGQAGRPAPASPCRSRRPSRRSLTGPSPRADGIIEGIRSLPGPAAGAAASSSRPA